uniref:uncharacterized protein n=1 Tax=Centroberyx gerrardi TaxID=166262 RepID=UPI003AAF1C1E
MKAASVFLLLGLAELLLSGPTDSTVSLNVSPNRQQFFESEFISLSCEQSSAGWTVKRRRGGGTEECGGEGGFGRFDGSSCRISAIFTSDSGVYWCETVEGERSDEVHITVSGGPVILEITALPVMKGSDVTLRCRTKSSSSNPADFLRNNTFIGAGPKGEFIIRNVQQSDAGSYRCNIELVADSPESRLSVRARPSTISPPTTTPLSTSLSPLSASSLPSLNSSSTDSPFSKPSRLLPVLGALLSVVLLVLLLIGGLLLRRKRAGSSSSPPPVDVTYADVTIRPAANRKEKRPADPDTVYSDVKTHKAATSHSDDVTYADIKHQKKKRSKRRESGPDPLYSDVKLQPGEVTYGQVVIKPQKKTGTRTAQPSDPDVVYSSVRAGHTAGNTHTHTHTHTHT